MSSLNTRRKIRLIIIIIEFSISTALIATQPLREGYPSRPTPIKVSLDYSTNKSSYFNGDTLTIRFNIYINKSDKENYTKGRRYLIGFGEPIVQLGDYYGWKVLKSSVSKGYIILNDEHSHYLGFVTMKCLREKLHSVMVIYTFRITKESKNKYGEPNKFIGKTEYYCDQFQDIFFHNPNVDILNTIGKKTIDFDEKMQSDLLQRKNARLKYPKK